MFNIPKVLIVDDDETICDFISESLISQGYTCDFSLTAQCAAAKLNKHHFDIVLLDIKLPDESGLDFLKTLQAFFIDASIVMITATNDLEIAVRAMKLGASDYVVKPFTIERLITSINTILEKRPRHNSNSNNIQTSINIIPDGPDASVHNKSNGIINAIAFGIDAQVDYFDFHSETVTSKTIELAHQMDLPEDDIKKWEIERYRHISERDRYIRSALIKLGKNPIAQAMLGLARPVYEFLKAGGQQN